MIESNSQEQTRMLQNYLAYNVSANIISLIRYYALYEQYYVSYWYGKYKAAIVLDWLFIMHNVSQLLY